MTTPNIDEIFPQSMLGFRLKGSSIFYSCTVLEADKDKIVINTPILMLKPFEINTRVELRLPVISGAGSVLFSGTITDLSADSLEIRITSKQDHVEKRKSIRISSEAKIKYIEEKVPEEVWHTTYSINISHGGIRIYSARFHQEGDALIFQFSIPDGYSSRFLLAKGRVVNVKKVTDYTSQYNSKSQGYRRYIVQICFEGLSLKDYIDILRYINTTLKNK
ncbi:MAG: hypothetical protein VR68_08320 [Peptococcaceae bacterium BRH_c4a]|nr:MAG: hypothetical protein VR68_08320 [Peptococcaceae bacterium BRH_c4a]